MYSYEKKSSKIFVLKVKGLATCRDMYTYSQALLIFLNFSQNKDCYHLWVGNQIIHTNRIL